LNTVTQHRQAVSPVIRSCGVAVNPVLKGENALLASTDHEHSLFTKGDRSREPVLCEIARSGLLSAARALIRVDHEVVEQRHNVFVKKDEFDGRFNVGAAEGKTGLAECSIWTLAKALTAQLQAGVDRCFERRLKGLPILPAPKETKQRKQTDEDGRRVREKPTQRAVEEAAWGGLASPDFCGVVDDLAKHYNNTLWTVPDFSSAYKAANTLSRTFRDQKREQLKVDYEKKKAEGRANRGEDRRPAQRGNAQRGNAQGGSTQRTSEQGERKQQTQTGGGSSGSNQKARQEGSGRVQVRKQKPRAQPEIDEDGFQTVRRRA